VVVDGMVWMVVGTGVGAGIGVGVGVPRLNVQPAMQTVPIRSMATRNRYFFPIIIVTAYFFIQIIVMDSPRAGWICARRMRILAA
jgi:hypothetical protein